MIEINHKKQLKLKACLFLASTLISILFLEIGLQGLYRFRSGSWLWEDNKKTFLIGYTQPVSDRRQYALRKGYSNKKFGITINEYGFRGPVPIVHNQGIIVSIGDSVPFGVDIRDDETYPAILDATLKSLHSDIRVINAGVPSYNMRQAFDRLMYDVLKHFDKKKIIAVTVQAANDISLLTQYREKWNPDRTWGDIRWGASWHRPSNIAIANHLKQLSKKFLSKNRQTVLSKNRQTEQHENYSGKNMLKNLRVTLQKLRSFGENNGIPIILMPIDPFYYQTKNLHKNSTLKTWENHKYYIGLWHDLIGKFNNELILASKQSKFVFFFDTRSIFDNIDRNPIYIDFIHYSPHGNRIVAEYLLSFLEKNALIVNY